jgi:phosphatidylglycerophosphatase C
LTTLTDNGRQGLPVLAVFDFDGTLTYRDSFVPFLRFAFGNKIFIRKLLRMARPSHSYLMKRISRDDLKAQLIRTFLRGVTLAWLEQQAQYFCDKSWAQLMRPKGLVAVSDQLLGGATVTICSASPALTLKPFAAKLGVQLIGTQLEAVNGILTGEIEGQNCRCVQKVMRLEAEYGSLKHYLVRAWGDSPGDEQLLAVAQEPRWREFHKVKRNKIRKPKVPQKST